MSQKVQNQNEESEDFETFYRERCNAFEHKNLKPIEYQKLKKKISYYMSSAGRSLKKGLTPSGYVIYPRDENPLREIGVEFLEKIKELTAQLEEVYLREAEWLIERLIAALSIQSETKLKSIKFELLMLAEQTFKLQEYMILNALCIFKSVHVFNIIFRKLDT